MARPPPHEEQQEQGVVQHQHDAAAAAGPLAWDKRALDGQIFELQTQHMPAALQISSSPAAVRIHELLLFHEQLRYVLLQRVVLRVVPQAGVGGCISTG